MHSGTMSGKSYTMFTINQGLLARCVDAVQEGEKLARSSGQIQSFEVFRNGHRMNLVLGRIMVIPPSVCNNKEDFPVTLLYGALVKELRPEDLSDLMAAKIGESSFDEYDDADMQEIKEKLFKVPGTKGKYSCLVTFVPSWTSPREYVYFKYEKDPDKLANALRHLVFAAFYDPRLSSAFNHLMQDTDTVNHGSELDVTNITPKLPYPGVAEGALKYYPDLQSADDTEASQDRPTGSDKKKKKKKGSFKPKMILAADTANQAIADVLSEGEVDVLSAVTDATEAAILNKRVTPSDAAEDENAAKSASGQGYQPKTGQPCSCRPGQQRDNCPACEGTGMRIDFKAIRDRFAPNSEKKAHLVSAAGHIPCPHCKHSEANIEELENHINRAHKKLAMTGHKLMEWCSTTPQEHEDHKRCPGVVDGAHCSCQCHERQAAEGVVASSKSASAKKAYNPGEEVYIYQADLYCAECGEQIKAELDTKMNADGHPLKPEGDETTYDSDTYPKGPYPDGGGEADGPQNCAGCRKFLENPLTRDGYEYLRSMVHEAEAKGRGNEPHIREWKAFYPEAFSASDDEDQDYNLGAESHEAGGIGNTPQDQEITELFKKKDQLKAEGKDKIKGGEYDAILRELQTKTKARLGSLKAKIAVQCKTANYKLGKNKSAFKVETRVAEGKDQVFKEITSKLNEKFQEIKSKNPQGFMDQFEQQLDTILLEVGQSLGLQLHNEGDTYVFTDQVGRMYKPKQADTADNAANEADGAGTIAVKTETSIKNTRGTEPELAPSKNAAAKEAKDINGMYGHPDAERARRNHPDLGNDLTGSYRLGGYLPKDDAPQAVRDHINSTYVMESSIRDKRAAAKEAAGAEFCAECGGPIAFDLDSPGVSHHVTEWGEIDYDLDADHTAYGEGENFLDGPRRTNAAPMEAASSRTLQARAKHEAKLNLRPSYQGRRRKRQFAGRSPSAV